MKEEIKICNLPFTADHVTHFFFCKKHDGQLLNAPLQLFFEFKILFHYQNQKISNSDLARRLFFVTKTVIFRQVSGLILLFPRNIGLRQC